MGLLLFVAPKGRRLLTLFRCVTGLGSKAGESRQGDENAFCTRRQVWCSGQDLLDHLAVHVGQAALDAVVVVGQLLVVEAEQVQDGGVEVVDASPGSRPAGSRPRRRRRSAKPGFRPAPAIQQVKASGWWSRPLPPTPCVNGVRPNSVVQSTSVSSSMPRAFRSFSSPATGLIHDRRLLACGCRRCLRGRPS